MIEQGKCPLCGESNHCASLLDVDPSTCWCMTKKVPKDLLKRIPEEYRNQSCVCEKCVDTFKEENNES